MSARCGTKRSGQYAWGGRSPRTCGAHGGEEGEPVRTRLAAAALLAVVPWPTPDRGSVHTVAQQDLVRTALDARSASVSADGRYVAFTSYAPLVPADTNSRQDVYVLDRADGHVTLESVSRSG